MRGMNVKRGRLGMATNTGAIYRRQHPLGVTSGRHLLRGRRRLNQEVLSPANGMSTTDDC